MPYYVIKPNADLQALLKQTPEVSLPPRLLKVDSAPVGLSDRLPVSALEYLEETESGQIAVWLGRVIQAKKA